MRGPVVACGTTGYTNQKPGRAARLFCLVKDINFINVKNRTTIRKVMNSLNVVGTSYFVFSKMGLKAK